MDQLKIKRINELARKMKTCGLTPEEKHEQQLLRNEYIAAFRSNLKATLDNVVIVGANGDKRKLKQNKPF